MGIFDRFKKKTNNEDVNISAQVKREESPYEMRFNWTYDGRLVCELYERRTKANQFYDTTRLIIDKYPRNVHGVTVQNCMVSWYGRSDCVYFGSQGETYGRMNDYKNIFAQIDTNLLQTDGNYGVMVMKKLLNEKRVEQYLENGLKDDPDRPCGKYIGGVVQKDNEEGYTKIFDARIGRIFHNLPEMVHKRTQLKEQEKAKKEQERAEIRSQISALQKKLEDDEWQQ